MSFTLRSLTYPDLLQKAVQLAARQLGEPSFPDTVWQRDRQRMVASIREANTRPGTIAARAFNQAVYGSHPYGYDTTEESLARITVQDMRRVLPQHPALPGQGERGRGREPGPGRPDRHDPARAPARGRLQPLPPVPEVTPLTAAPERNIPSPRRRPTC